MNIYASNCVYAVKSNGEMEFCVFLGTKNSIYAHTTHVYILGVYVCLWKFLNINLYNICILNSVCVFACDAHVHLSA